MSPWLVLIVFSSYAAVLMGVSFFTSRRALRGSTDGGRSQFFLAGRTAPWYVVAFGMLGASLSGVTFISVPGWVGSQHFAYMQMVLGYLAGYAVIMGLLLPLYYRLKLTSIYTYLKDRFGTNAYRTGAAFFVLSRVIGASFRLFLVAMVLDLFVLEPLGWSGSWGVPLAAIAVLAVIYAYTRRAGLATIIWTDTLQTAAMLVAVVVTMIAVAQQLNWPLSEIPARIADSQWSNVWIWDDWRAPNHALKHFLAGMFVCIAMTGLDQDMMQKNLSCRSLKAARLNMGSFAVILVVVNLLFLGLGAMLFDFGGAEALALERSDHLFPTAALAGTLGPVVAVMFLVGLMAAAFSSADSALTALTTSVCIDLLETEKMDAERASRIRGRVHLGMAGVLVLVIAAFNALSDESVVSAIFKAATYTYGPLLGLFAFGLFTKSRPADRWIPLLAIASPILCFCLETGLVRAFDFSFGFALLPVNGGLMAIGLALLSKPIPRA